MMVFLSDQILADHGSDTVKPWCFRHRVGRCHWMAGN